MTTSPSTTSPSPVRVAGAGHPSPTPRPSSSPEIPARAAELREQAAAMRRTAGTAEPPVRVPPLTASERRAFAEWLASTDRWERTTPEGRSCRALEAEAERLIAEPRPSPIPANVPPAARSMTFERWRNGAGPLGEARRAVRDAVRRWCAASYPRVGREPLVLWLQGASCGVGKTHLAFSALHWWAERGATTTSEVVGAFFAEQRRSFSSPNPTTVEDIAQRRRRLEQVDVALLDDLGTHRGTEHEISELFAVLDARLTHHRVTIVTTNHPPFRSLGGQRATQTADLADGVTLRRLASRMRGPHVTSVTFEHLPDVRESPVT